MTFWQIVLISSAVLLIFSAWWAPRKGYTLDCIFGFHTSCDLRSCTCPHHHEPDQLERCTCGRCADYIGLVRSPRIDLTKLHEDEFVVMDHPRGWNLYRSKEKLREVELNIEVIDIEREQG